MVFENQQNGYQEKVGWPFLWCLIFGVFYFAVKGIWRHALIGAVAALFTAGLSWLIYPFFAGSIIRAAYLRKGWLQIE
jgi:hypothetical protein